MAGEGGRQQGAQRPAGAATGSNAKRIPRVVDTVLAVLQGSLWLCAVLNILEMIYFTTLFTFQVLLCFQVALETVMMIVLFFVSLETVEWKSGRQKTLLRKLSGAFLGCIVEVACIIWIIVQTFVIQGRYAAWDSASQGIFSFRQLVWAPAFWCLFHRSLHKIATESSFLQTER